MAVSVDAFDIFNDRYYGQENQFSVSKNTPAGTSSFPLWSHLPQEIRLNIWTRHLHQRRFLRILLEERTNESSSPNLETKKEDGDSYIGEWDAVLSEEQLQGLQDSADSADPERDGLLRITFLDDPAPPTSALQLVCRESYKAYMSFYPIHLQALVRVSCKPGVYWETETARIIAHLHPDLDILSLQASYAPHIIQLNLLPMFLHTLVQYDSSPASRRFGIRNLCVDLDCLTSDNAPFDSSNTTSLPLDILASVRLTISHLRNLYIRLLVPHIEPRVTSGPLIGSGALPWYNASMPIIPNPSWDFTSTVQAVEGLDPRLALPEGLADLHQVWIGSQIRPSLDIWAYLERIWGARAGADVPGGVCIRALIGLDAQSITRPDLYKRSLRDAMREEHAAWVSWLDPTTDSGLIHRELFENARQRFVDQSADAETGSITPEDWVFIRRSHTAVGFWLVEPEALETAKTTGCTRKQVADLSVTGKDAIELWVFEPSAKT